MRKLSLFIGLLICMGSFAQVQYVWKINFTATKDTLIRYGASEDWHGRCVTARIYFKHPNSLTGVLSIGSTSTTISKDLSVKEFVCQPVTDATMNPFTCDTTNTKLGVTTNRYFCYELIFKNFGGTLPAVKFTAHSVTSMPVYILMQASLY